MMSLFKNMQETRVTNKKGITKWDPEISFTDFSKVDAALLECLVDNDTETFIEILDSYLRVNKLQVEKKAKMDRIRR